MRPRVQSESVASQRSRVRNVPASSEESKRSRSANQALPQSMDSDEAVQIPKRGRGRPRRQLPPSIESLTESEQEQRVSVASILNESQTRNLERRFIGAGAGNDSNSI